MIEPRALLTLLLVTTLAACATPEQNGAPGEPDGHATSAPDGGVTVLYRTVELDATTALAVANEFAVVRAAVAKELGLEGTPNEVPRAEIVVYRDPAWGQEYFLVTHAQIRDNPLRVHIPCLLPPGENDGAAIAQRFRGTVAHEVAEATVLTHVPILDPYLRWMHDGIAESVSYRVLARLDPQAAALERDRYLERWRQARAGKLRWVDLGGWRQPSDWIVHSEALFTNRRPLELTDIPGSLKRVGEERFAAQEQHPDEVVTLDALAEFLGNAWMRERLLPGEGEVDLRQRDGHDPASARFKDTQFLCYGAGMCLWLELERASPGATGKVLAAMMARRATVLRSSDVVEIIEALTKVDLRPRIERFTFERLERVLGAER